MTRSETTAEILKAVQAQDWRARWFPRRTERLIEHLLDALPPRGNLNDKAYGLAAEVELRRAAEEYKSIWLSIVLALLPFAIQAIIDWWKRDPEAAFKAMEGWQ